ncbi:MAG TPA: hypothetical protein VGM05_10895 [Planctomycetaceae bacterium]|jgi:hypothetical protein
MAKFSEDGDGVERCQKRVPIRLSREETNFCFQQIGRISYRNDDGGGPAVDQYLSQILASALRQAMDEQNSKSLLTLT